MQKRTRTITGLAAGALVATLCATSCTREAPPAPPVAKQKLPTSLTLPERPGPHWFWLSDIVFHRTSLFDADTGQQLGSISSGTAGQGFIIYPLFSPDHREIYIAESYFSRGVRGERTDVVTVYDARTLEPTAEIPIPPHRAEFFPGNASNALSDDGRYMAVFNLTPASSLTIVDVKERKLVREVETPGCGLVFAAGDRRFLTVCANGGVLLVTVPDGEGEPVLERSEPFFDPQKDPVTEKAVRRGNEWLFVSFDGMVHSVDVSGDKPRFAPPWSLLDDSERKSNWRIGGAQHLGVHGKTGRLYAVMHQGPVDTHKEAGPEVWVFDLATKKRVRRIQTPNPLVSFIGLQGGIDASTTSGSFVRWLLGAALPHLGVTGVIVTQDDNPVLITYAAMPPAVTVHDALSGAVLREVSEPALAGSLLYTP